MGFHTGNRPTLNTLYGGAAGGTGPANNGNPLAGTLSFTRASIDPTAGTSYVTFSKPWNDCAITNDGTRLFVAPFNENIFFGFKTNTPYNFDTVSEIKAIGPAASGFQFNAAMDMSDDGTRFWSAGFTSDIYQINLNPTKPFDITDRVSISPIGRDELPSPIATRASRALLGLRWGRDKRTCLFVHNISSTHILYTVKTSADYDLTQVISAHEKIFSPTVTNVAQGATFNYNGTQIFWAHDVDWASPGISLLNLTTPYDISTAVYQSTFAIAPGAPNLGSIGGIDYFWDGTNHNLFVVSNSSQTGSYGIYTWAPT